MRVECLGVLMVELAGEAQDDELAESIVLVRGRRHPEANSTRAERTGASDPLTEVAMPYAEVNALMSPH